jgi:hypothetical protein
MPRGGGGEAAPSQRLIDRIKASSPTEPTDPCSVLEKSGEGFMSEGRR